MNRKKGIFPWLSFSGMMKWLPSFPSPISHFLWVGLLWLMILDGEPLQADNLFPDYTLTFENLSKSASKNKSMGMQITAHRLELINALQEKATTVEVVDLVDSSGEPCGTKVVLEIPV